VCIVARTQRHAMQVELALSTDKHGLQLQVTLWCESAREQEECLRRLNGHRRVFAFVAGDRLAQWQEHTGRGEWKQAAALVRHGFALFDASFVWTGRPGARGFEKTMRIKNTPLTALLVNELERSVDCEEALRLLEHLALERDTAPLIPLAAAKSARRQFPGGRDRTA
jgi:hypothetical protein